jgi:hypothetical protein
MDVQDVDMKDELAKRDFQSFAKYYMNQVDPMADFTKRGGWRAVVGGLVNGLMNPKGQQQAAQGALQLFMMQKELEASQEAHKMRKKDLELRTSQVQSNLETADLQRKDAQNKLQMFAEVWPQLSQEQKTQSILKTKTSGMERILLDPEMRESYVDMMQRSRMSPTEAMLFDKVEGKKSDFVVNPNETYQEALDRLLNDGKAGIPKDPEEEPGLLDSLNKKLKPAYDKYRGILETLPPAGSPLLGPVLDQIRKKGSRDPVLRVKVDSQGRAIEESYE